MPSAEATIVPAAPRFSLLGIDARPDPQIRRSVAVTIVENAITADAARIGEVFLKANEEGCSYELGSVLPPEIGPSAAAPDSRWHVVVIPPLSRWLGISPRSAHARWANVLVRASDHVIAIGTGAFLLAASGCLDGHDVVAGADYARELAVVAPGARVHQGISALRDRRIGTAIFGSSAESLCTALVADDYGVDVHHRLATRLAADRHPRGFEGTWR